MFRRLLVLFILSVSLYANNISTYLYSYYLPINFVDNKLKHNGFDVIGSYHPMQNDKYTVLVITSNELKDLASKDGREFAGVLKVLIDDENKRIVVSNPEYFLRAFLQDDFNKQNADKITQSLKRIFPNIKNSKYSLDENDISEYHFMFAMPYYEDKIEVASGNNLNNKIITNASKNIVFSLKLNNNATLYGVSMNGSLGEEYYLNAIEQKKHSVLLPYMVLVKNNKAYILHPKYYLAVSLPALSMGEFMTISDIPGEIEDYFKSLFQ